MTVSSIEPVNNYAGNNSATRFDFDFFIENENELLVQLTNKTGYQTTLKLNTDYTINEIGSENGSYIIFPIESSEYNVLSEDEVITLSLNLKIVQEKEFKNSSKLSLKTLENALDYLTRLIQILSRKMERAVKVKEGINIAPDKLMENINECVNESFSFSEESKKSSQNAQKNAQLAKEWAVKEIEKVEATDYSSKYYAEKSKKSAQLSEEKAQETNEIYINAKEDLQKETNEKINKIIEEGDKQYNKIQELGFYQKDGKFFYINEKGEETPLKFEKTDNLFDLVQKDHKLTLEEKEGLEELGEYVYKEAQDRRRGYSDFYEKCLEEYNEAQENTEEIEGITIKIHSNGHKYYNISDKAKIDTLYKDTGVAWYYGIDEEEERILLPRNDYKGKSSENYMPDYNSGKIIDIKNNVAQKITEDGWLCMPMSQRSNNKIMGSYNEKMTDSFQLATGTFDYVAGTPSSSYFFPVYKGMYITNSGVFTTLNTVFYPKKKQEFPENYIYMVVGNVSVVQAKSEVTKITTSENDTLPLFTSMYFDFTPNHVSWLKAGEVAEADTYISAYNELVKISDGEESEYRKDFKIVEENSKVEGVDYSDYWIIDKDKRKFTAPTKKRSDPTYHQEVIHNNIEIGSYDVDLSHIIPDDGYAYDVIIQISYRFNDTNTKNRNIGIYDETSAKLLLYHVADGGSEGGSAADIVRNAPIHLSSDMRKIIIKISGTDDVQFDSLSIRTISFVKIGASTSENLYYKVANAVQNLEVINAGFILENCVFKTQLVEAQTVIETYQNGSSGYRVWSDGWCEQWGRVSSGQSNINVSFLKAFSNTNYNAQATSLTNANGVSSDGSIGVLTATGMTIINNGYRYPMIWKVEGYLAEGTY